MITGLLQFFFALSFIALVCVFAYKVTIFLSFKIIDLCFSSTLFRLGASIFLGFVFCIVGVLQLKDFIEGSGLWSSQFFILSFLVSGFFFVIGFRWPTK